MALSYTQKTSDNTLITKYVSANTVPFSYSRHSCDVGGQQSLYDQFGTYLTQNGLYMASQFSSDSFAGALPNQTNLAVKVSLTPCRLTPPSLIIAILSPQVYRRAQGSV
jgi:hypothetical protein